MAMKLIHPPYPDDLVTFNVRGRIFQTTLTTLRRFPESVLYKMVDWEQKSKRDTSSKSLHSEAFFIDRDPDLFATILHYHDTDKYFGGSFHDVPSSSGHYGVTPKSLFLEAQYYNIQLLEREIMEKETASTVKYECCIVTADDYGGFSSQRVKLSNLPLSKEAVDGYLVDHALNGLNLVDRYLLDTIMQFMTRWNTADTSNEYNWTIMAISTNGKPVENAGGVIVILKGEKRLQK